MTANKFKGKRKDNGEWVYGSLIAEDYILYYIDEVNYWNAFTSEMHVHCRAFEVQIESLCQLVEILPFQDLRLYENDIVEYDHEDGIVRAKVAHYKFDDETVNINGFKYEVLFVYGYPDDDTEHEGIQFRIIGNSIDNPELLKP